MAQIKNAEEWHKIGDRLTAMFNICSCQRKLKTIVDNLYSIYVKLDAGTLEYDFTGTEWLIIAMMDKHTNAVCHGVNCEYPILNREDPFWKWILEVKDSPYLENN